MAFRAMYPPQKDSPSTFLLGDISAVDTLMTVSSVLALPQTLPYPLTIGVDKTFTETVMVTAQNTENNQITMTRGTPAYTWMAGSKVARVLTAKDFKDVQDNIIDLDADLSSAKTTIAAHNTDILELETAVGDTDSGIVKGLADEITRATAAENAEATRATAAEGNLDIIKVNRSELAQVITDWSYSADATKVLVTITRYNASTQQVSQYTKTLPVASDDAMGVMTPEAYSEIAALRTDVNALINLGGRFIGVSFATKAMLDAYVVPSNVKTGDFTYVLDDETKSGATTRYVRNENAWDFTFIIDYDPVGIADTVTPGIVKSSKIIGDWTARTSAADNTWTSVCYGNGLFVAVADSGTGTRVMTSPDGINWTIRTSAANNNWNSVCYGNGLFVAVANSGTGTRVMTSPDGINWTIRTSPADNQWHSVCYGNGMFVAVAATTASGGVDGIMTSPDGFNWTLRNAPTSGTWTSVCYGNGLFVAVTNNYTAMTSPDGITWTGRNAQNRPWVSVCYGNGLFVAVSSFTIGRVMTSANGINWTERNMYITDRVWQSVCYGNGLFVAVASSAANAGTRIATSPDGITWTSRTSPADNQWMSVCYGNGLLVAVASSGAGNRVMMSPGPSTGKNYVEIDGSMSVIGWDDLQNRVSSVENNLLTKNTKEILATLSTTWAGTGPYTQNVSISGLGAIQNGTVGISKNASAAERSAARDAQLAITAQAANSITITADGDKPTISIPISVILMP